MVVKRALAVLALLAVTACDPYYGQEPYGPAPYPAPYPQEPYPPQPGYPGQEPYPPAPGYPGQTPYQPSPPECLITSSRDWTAWVNRMPGPTGARPMLVVSGKVAVPTGGFQVAFDPRMQVRESHPAQAFVTLQVAGPDGAPASQAQVTHEVRWEWPLNQPVGSVIVSCGDKTLAEITRIQTAY